MSGIDIARQIEVEQFLYREAELLDDHDYDRWLDLFTDDARYRMPTRGNRLRRERGTEDSAPGELSLFDDDRVTLGWRVRQLGSATHWAEDPPSRTRHLVSNVRISGHDDGELGVRSNFVCYRNRLADEVDIWAGERHDVLRDVAGEWRIASRVVMLDQSVVLSKNLSVLF